MPVPAELHELHRLHQVTRMEHDGEPYAELCYFLQNRINNSLKEAPAISADQLIEWMKEHVSYCGYRKTELKYSVKS